MRKYFILFLAALVLPVACTEILIEAPEVAEEQTATHLVLSANSSAMTKAVLNEDNSVSFIDTDALSVFDADYNNCEFTVQKLYSNGSADFEGDVESIDGPLPVMYPYQADASMGKYGPTAKLYFQIPGEQNAVQGSFDPAAAISLGVAEMTDDGIACASLDNVCALVKFTMPKGSYSKVTLTANGNEYLCGSYNVNVGSVIGDVITAGSGESSVSLAGEIDGEKTYYLSVFPCTSASGITVRIYDTNGDLAGEKSTTKQVTFTKGKILNLGTLPSAGDSEKWLGEGTASSPYIIASKKHLELLADAFSIREKALPYKGKYFKQVSDIDMGGEAITIGNYADRYQDTSWQEPTSFNASYDGGGHTISNYRLKFIHYNLDAHNLAGLFNNVSNANISNLSLRPALYDSGYLIDGLNSSVEIYYIGLLAGEVNGVCTISNCHVLSGDYTVSAADEGFSLDPSQIVILGGLVGYTAGNAGKNITFSNCTNSANLKIEKGRYKAVAGGILGSNYGYSQYQYMDRCRNKGDISVVSENEKAEVEVIAGGIVGRITDDGSDVVFRISNCVNEGDILAENKAPKYACAGGIAGSNDSDGMNSTDPWVYNCLNKGDIHAKCLDGIISIDYEAVAGGIFGYCYDNDTKLALCVNVGRISAEGAPVIGPICGEDGDQWWCFWLDTDEFDGYKPDSYFHCYSCTGSIKGSGTDAGTPEYVRLHGKANDGETGDSLFDKTEWSQSQWASAAAWKGESDLYWNTQDHKNTLDLDF